MSDQARREKYTAVIGLEVHAQLLTKSKIFAADANTFGSAPNTNVSAISLGHPGTLPLLNKTAVEFAIRMGLACHSTISRRQIFDRKNYFYPDLPKGYQITQDRTPVCVGGYVSIRTRSGVERNISLHRIHLEEDAGKSIHSLDEPLTQVDFNRAGVPLIEIVTNPEIYSSDEAYALLTEIRQLVRYLDICDGNMEEGSLRCDANISVRLADAKGLGKKVEVKNMNSIRNVQRAIDHEIERQIDLLEAGRSVVSETRTFNAADGKTYGMRTKEELNDYRYFPDPDLSPIEISEEWLEKIRATMPALARDLQAKFVTTYGLPEYDAGVLTDNKEMAAYFEALCQCTTNYKAASNWIMGPIKSYLNEQRFANTFPIQPQKMASLIDMVSDGKVSFTIAAQKILPELLTHPDSSPSELATSLNLIQESDADLIMPLVEEVIKEFPLKVEAYKNGKKGIISMFMGEVMKRSKGKVDPRMATQLLEKKLAEE